MAFVKPLKRYAAFFYPFEGNYSGRINLYCKGDKLYLFFLESSDSLPNNTYDDSFKTGRAYQPFSKYEHYLDLIRNEEPISVTFSPEVKPPTFVVYCASEPPGEGEI